MNFEKVVFSLFTFLALSLNFAFVYGASSPDGQHLPHELFAALVVSLICTVMKFGDKSQFGASMLAAGLAANILLVSSAIVWGYTNHISEASGGSMTAVSLAAGALIAHTIAVVMLVIEITQNRK